MRKEIEKGKKQLKKKEEKKDKMRKEIEKGKKQLKKEEKKDKMRKEIELETPMSLYSSPGYNNNISQ
jgi:septal ring factor EnvC (AmiA/AmiB activator)